MHFVLFIAYSGGASLMNHRWSIKPSAHLDSSLIAFKIGPLRSCSAVLGVERRTGPKIPERACLLQLDSCAPIWVCCALSAPSLSANHGVNITNSREKSPHSIEIGNSKGAAM